MRSVAATSPALQLTVALAEPPPADPSGCHYGPLAEVLAADLPLAGLAALYMPGPPGLIDHAMALLVRSGRVPAACVYFGRNV